MRLLRSFAYLAIFYAATIVLIFVALIATLLGRPALLAIVRLWRDLHSWLTRHLLGIRSELEGAIPPGAVLLAVKHQSMYETLEFLRFVEMPVVVLKRELADIPLFGWLVRRYGVIPVDRSAGASALRAMMKLGKEATASGRPIAIFPEGTRVKPGETPPLGSGFAGLYRALGLPVVPIAVDSGKLWCGPLDKRSGTVRFVVGETIPPGLKRDEIEKRVHSAINALEQSAA